MLAVAVHTNSDVVAVLEREPKARLHGAADAEVEGKTKHPCALRSRNLRRAVERAVVHDHDIEPRVECTQLIDHAADGVLLVESRNDRHPAKLAQARIDGRRRRGCDGLAHAHEGSVRGRRGRRATTRKRGR